MDGDTLARLGYLGLLLVSVGGWFVVENRGRMGAALRMVLVWGLIFLGVIAARGLWLDVRDEVMPRQAVMSEGGRIELPRDPDGHFHLVLEVGGVPVRFMVDTGASSVVLSNRDAERLGIDRRTLAFTGSARTANGTIRTARVVLQDVTLGGVPQQPVVAWVGDGELEMSLLGMDFLDRFAAVEIAGDRLVLRR
jgi:aspartyl protease family protein